MRLFEACTSKYIAETCLIKMVDHVAMVMVVGGEGWMVVVHLSLSPPHTFTHTHTHTHIHIHLVAGTLPPPTIQW